MSAFLEKRHPSWREAQSENKKEDLS
jgi:hypothetical protein